MNQTPATHSCQQIADALVQCLRQVRDVTSQCTPEQYTRKPVGQVQSAVGPHVRHVLDHAARWLDSVPDSEINYDARSRGTSDESEPLAAVARIDELIARLSGGDFGSLPGQWTLRMLTHETSEPVVVPTTPERELLFVFSHTVHHMAIIAVMARTLGLRVPDRFGYAPSTPQTGDANGQRRAAG